MRMADLTLPTSPDRMTADVASLETIRGWGGGRGVSAALVRPRDEEGVRAALALGRGPGAAGQLRTGAIPRGMGRSYGDAAQLDGGMVLDMTGLKGFQLDERGGTVTAQAGVTIGELLAKLVPAGWMIPTVPGTQHVSVGGAIASDIHGKNHATAGTFGSHVSALGLLTASGQLLECTPRSEVELFSATVGGMGLTGVILWATVRLRPIASPLLSVDTDRAANLDDALALLSAPGGPHRVAWLDLLGPRAGRGIVTRAEHLDEPGGAETRSAATVPARATVPAGWPAGALRASTVAVFNELRYRRAPRRQRGHVQGLGAHMFPLDALQAWPRLYGKPGLLQYQFAVPTGAEHVLGAVIGHLRNARVPCFLAVLKDFGPASPAPLSFPLAGWTLALDLPRAAPGIDAALDRCDELVAAAGGRVYLSKDARLRPDMVAAMYPRLAEWQAVRNHADPDGMWSSDLSRRTGLAPMGAQ
jgi:decaprenylphospho-beta-D-ribofuranose 2-oxidase